MAKGDKHLSMTYLILLLLNLMSNSTPGGFLFLMRSVLSFKGYDGFLESRRGGGEGDSGDIKVHMGSLKIKFWDKI